MGGNRNLNKSEVIQLHGNATLILRADPSSRDFDHDAVLRDLIPGLATSPGSWSPEIAIP